MTRRISILIKTPWGNMVMEQEPQTSQGFILRVTDVATGRFYEHITVTPADSRRKLVEVATAAMKELVERGPELTPRQSIVGDPLVDIYEAELQAERDHSYE